MLFTIYWSSEVHIILRNFYLCSSTVNVIFSNDIKVQKKKYLSRFDLIWQYRILRWAHLLCWLNRRPSHTCISDFFLGFKTDHVTKWIRTGSVLLSLGSGGLRRKGQSEIPTCDASVTGRLVIVNREACSSPIEGLH